MMLHLRADSVLKIFCQDIVDLVSLMLSFGTGSKVLVKHSHVVSTASLNSPKLSRVFYNLLETRRTRFLFLSENTATKEKR